jgi:putative transposase
MSIRYAPLLRIGWRSGGRINFKGSHFEKAIILWSVRWYVAYPISCRQLEERMQEHGVSVDYSTLTWWVLKSAPAVGKQFHPNKRPVWGGAASR